MYRRIVAVWLSWVMVFSCVVIIINIVEPVSATTITVDDSGGANFFTITMAINMANDGDTVYVYSGTYNEHVVVDKTINLTGEDRDTTIIDGQGIGDVVYISANWVNVSGFTVRESGPNGNPRDAGIEVNNAHNTTISDSKFTDNRDAIYLHNSNDVFVENNLVDDFEGIHVELSRSITITGNILSNQYYGIYLDSSIMTKITDNTMTGDGLKINGNSTEYWNTHDIDTSNTVNGDPVYYWKNQTAGTVPTGAGQVILANCTNVNVENQQISDCYIGIILGYSHNNLIRNNNASSNHENGLYLYYSNNNTIESNTFNDAMNGIDFLISNGNNITGNYVSDNGGGMIFGGSHGNNITDNIFWDNLFGLMLVLSDGNNINDNNFTYNWAGPGVYIASSSDNIITNNMLFENKEGINITDFFYNSINNKIFHNSLIGNINQAYDDTIYENSWDNGYPSGGNYWDDYSGADTKNGPNQDISGADGIGDSPYGIEIDTFDNYPLMEPWGTDSTAPSIELISPSDNSFIDIGTKINISVSDLNLDEVTYSINNGGNKILYSPYDIDTGNWSDGDFEVEVQAKDTSDNIKTVVYHFYVDTNPPTITLESPDNNSLINADSLIEFTISDANINEVTYIKNSGVPTSLYQPYIINPSGWSEGEHMITVLAKDKASNSNERWYRFTLDKTSPQIILNSPENGSIIQDLSLDFEVSDENLNSVTYLKNQGTFTNFQAPYDFDTMDWNDGEYKITIKADDTAGNSNEKWFIFTKDSTSPSIVSIYPEDNSMDIQVNENIVIDFSEPMDTESVESAISISPYSEYSCSWSNDNSTLTLNFSDTLEYKTLYQISIGINAKDLASNNLKSKSEFEFITQDKQKSGVDESPMFPSIILILVLIIIIASIVIVLLSVKRKKNTRDRMSAWPQVQEQSMEIMCPQCGFYFMVVKTGGPIRVQCPNCKTTGTMR